MNDIIINTSVLPVFVSGDYLVAPEPFYHADRLLDFHVLLYVIEGTIFVTEGETDYEIKAGDLFFLKSGCHHFGKKEIAMGTKWIYVHFRYENTKHYQKYDRGMAKVEQYNAAMYETMLPKILSGLLDSRMEKHLIQFVDFIHENDTLNLWYINVRLFELLSEIAFLSCSSIENKSVSQRICDYLENHVMVPFSAASLEQEFYLSYKYMAACFKKEMKQSMQQYHTGLRMKAACRLLRSTLLNVKEIGMQLGYQDSLYFSRCFRQNVGMSPSAYRKEIFWKAAFGENESDRNDG